MSKIKRAIFPEAYALLDGVKACEHNNFNEYFEKCEDCNTSLYDMPKQIQRDYFAMFEDGDDPETLAERAEAIRDAKREDGEAV